MALSQHDLLRLMESLRTADGIELIRVLAQRILQELIEAEATAHIGAEPGEHADTRTTWRNGHRDKVLTTQAGDLDLAIPKVRTGSFFPSLLERRRRIDQALYAVIVEAYVHGVSTRSVDDLVRALGADSGISKSEVSRLCTGLDAELTVFRTRPLDHTRFPYIYLDATYCKARVNHQIVSQAVVIATGITEDGGREVLGLMVGDSETEAFWSEFLRSLRERGLSGVRLVIADHHSGLVKAVRKVMLGAGYQRCRVHFLRNVFAVIPKDSAEMVAATIRTVFAQPDAAAVRAQLDTVADMLGRQFPKVRSMLLEAKEDLTAFADFPDRHWKKIQSTNPLERINREIKRRTDVVQIFPNPDALERLTTAVLIEMHDEWIAFPRRYLPEGSMDKIYPNNDQIGPATPPQGT
ncbi:IS256 family transposase [Streptomyces sp. WMMC940]|uniref:IS256 family transposase n=1 Tax=Streptomyces sp. WMMC940 TaxID=3015153 RepID=UPI0022B67E78|nr:IS256 family transposase [Streptomyces sp. WMMC940]MCZ7456124.1 IS256 family transposase [Streptomyces sp. WMMC940]MCZ7456235.1 IS256 family transposase [Streptomyces sp. WMMC940]MCZ7462360.1 IS256 family transposase [Streptomyces sp. WMMC940]